MCVSCAALITPRGSYFASEIAGNRLANFGIGERGSRRLRVALSETDGGAAFPAQYHTGGVGMAVIIAGAGAIEIGKNEKDMDVYEFTTGDVVLITPELVYGV